ncbi:MAG: DNA repair protein RadA [Candidatus Saganbacteria bacterium]|nr:DNA repair protein RadA [Candidatus Saganbacteria bacterium]
MPKQEVRFLCQNCGYDSPRWLGRCPECGEWNAIVEEKVAPEVKTKISLPSTPTEKPRPITELDFKVEERFPTKIAELDRVLGGGIVSGSVVLVGGEPGIGKSTLMLQSAYALSSNGSSVLYVTGEESSKQLRLRAERLGALSPKLSVLPETNLFAIEKSIEEMKPKFVIIDSIQTIYREDIPSAPGSVSQVRECASYLTRIAKTSGIPLFLIGHVTKEGSIAGPRVLEHVVDTVLYFEGERYKQYRILRATKNRFGSTNEVGIFEMKEAGLKEVLNPSEVFLSERPEKTPGSVVTATIEGTRPLLVEIQALVSPSSMVQPRRTVTGIDYNRASIIIAVLERRLGLKLGSQDIYINVAGGVRVNEPAMDLPVAAAIASCFRDKAVNQGLVVVGEIGLGGEVRAVNHIEMRVKEAEKLGFKEIVIPRGNQEEVKNIKGIKVLPVSELRQVFTLPSFILS